MKWLENVRCQTVIISTVDIEPCYVISIFVCLQEVTLCLPVETVTGLLVLGKT